MSDTEKHLLHLFAFGVVFVVGFHLGAKQRAAQAQAAAPAAVDNSAYWMTGFGSWQA